MKKIIVGLKGGLGNQLFQYAFGKYLSEKYNCKLKLDKSLFAYYDLHDYSLDPYKLNEEFASEQEIPKQYLTNNKILRKVYTITDRFFCKTRIIKEESLSFNAELIQQNSDFIYLDGYWQSEKYFESIFEQMRHNLAIKPAFYSESNNNYLSDIQEYNSVSIHIRRGSYTIEKYQQVHGLTPLEYYNKAIQKIKRDIKSPKFFIFSDDTKWVRENFESLTNSTIIEGTPEKDYLDIFLMSQCKHNIIANSTFSWWGAWLNSNPHKIVIAPKIWYMMEDLNITTSSLIPNSWIRL
jgi:hypothetical protein